MESNLIHGYYRKVSSIYPTCLVSRPIRSPFVNTSIKLYNKKNKNTTSGEIAMRPYDNVCPVNSQFLKA